MNHHYTWKEEPGESFGFSLPLTTAGELDNLRIRREELDKKVSVNFEPMYKLQEKLKMHREILEKISSGEEIYYQFPFNPLIRAIGEWYEMPIDKVEKGTTISQYAGYIATGIKAIENLCEQIDSAPTMINIDKIKEIRDFSLLLSEEQLRFREPWKHYLAA